MSSRSAASREAVPTARTRKSPPVLARVSKILGLVARRVEERGQLLERVDAVLVEENRLPIRGRDRIGYQKLRIVALVPVHHRPDAPQTRTDRPIRKTSFAHRANELQLLLSVEFPNAHVAPYFKRIPLGCQMGVRARQMLAVIDPARLHDMRELGIAGIPAKVDAEILAFGPPQLTESLDKGGHIRLG